MKKRNLNIGIFWADPFCGNLGVQALAYSTIFIFEKISEKENIYFNYSFFGSSGQLKDSINLFGKTIRCNNLEGLNYYKIKSWVKLVLQKKAGLKQLLSLDLIVDVGGGDSYSDIYGKDRFYTINSTKFLGKLLRIQVVLFPQTIGPFSQIQIERLAFKTLQKADLIFARDDRSFKYIENIIPKKRLINSIDCAFFLPYHKKRFESIVINVGVNVSALLWHGGYTQNNQFRLVLDYKSLTIQVIEYMLSLPNIRLHLIPHVNPQKVIDYDSVENDYKICSHIHEIYPETILAPRYTNPVEVKGYISGLSFFIGARMHACIAAFSTGVPVLPLAYSRKFTGLFKESLGYEFVCDMTSDNIELGLNKIISAFDNRAILKEKIDLALPVINNKQVELLTKLGEIISCL